VPIVDVLIDVVIIGILRAFVLDADKKPETNF